MKNNGKPSEAQWAARLRSRYGKAAFIYRLADAADLTGLNRGMTGDKKALVITKKLPSDFIVTDPVEGMHYAEVKSTTNKTSFPFGQFEEGQWAAMRQQLAANGRYFVYIHNVITDAWYKVPGALILSISDTGKSSAKWDDLSPYTWSI